MSYFAFLASSKCQPTYLALYVWHLHIFLPDEDLRRSTDFNCHADLRLRHCSESLGQNTAFVSHCGALILPSPETFGFVAWNANIEETFPSGQVQPLKQIMWTYQKLFPPAHSKLMCEISAYTVAKVIKTVITFFRTYFPVNLK